MQLPAWFMFLFLFRPPHQIAAFPLSEPPLVVSLGSERNPIF